MSTSIKPQSCPIHEFQYFWWINQGIKYVYVANNFTENLWFKNKIKNFLFYFNYFILFFILFIWTNLRLLNNILHGKYSTMYLKIYSFLQYFLHYVLSLYCLTQMQSLVSKNNSKNNSMRVYQLLIKHRCNVSSFLIILFISRSRSW